jgi:ABC-type Mn2+/Zn2+ transport system ATPase subunit
LFAVLEILEALGSGSFNVLCLDEIFSSLDLEGKEGLFRVLSHLQNKGKGIYTIAHSELALAMVYDSIISATKHEDGTTTIKQ